MNLDKKKKKKKKKKKNKKKKKKKKKKSFKVKSTLSTYLSTTLKLKKITNYNYLPNFLWKSALYKIYKNIPRPPSCLGAIQSISCLYVSVSVCMLDDFWSHALITQLKKLIFINFFLANKIILTELAPRLIRPISRDINVSFVCQLSVVRSSSPWICKYL